MIVDLWSGILRRVGSAADASWVLRHHRELWIRLLVLALLCQVVPLSAGCGGAAPVTSVPVIKATTPLSSGALFCPDEYLKWSLRWKGLEAASTEMITGRPGLIGGRDAIIVHSLTRSSELAAIFREVREELTSQISLLTALSIQNRSNTVEDGASELLDVKFASDDTSYTADLHGTVDPRQWTQEAPATTDLHSFLARLRLWDGEPAEGAFGFVQSGRSHFRVDLARAGRASIETILGKVPAIRVHGRATRLFKDGKKVPDPAVREFTLWRSDDERFLPLRFEVETRLGVVRGTLVDFRQPDISACLQVSPT